MAGQVIAEISMSLDGFVAGPHDGLGRGLGDGGEPIHNWIMGGQWDYAGGTPFSATGVDEQVMHKMFAGAGAAIVGRRMYDVVDGWGDEAAFPFPVFVLTSRAHPYREVRGSSYTFVTDGIDRGWSRPERRPGTRR
jgi:dihydrofolate reductase